MPMKNVNDQIIGVLEIASLVVFQDYQIEFVERIGTSIASSLSGEQNSPSFEEEDEPKSDN